METTMQSPAEVASRREPAEGESGLFSIESVLKLQKSIFAGFPLAEVLTNIAQLVEAQAEGMSCTIWLPDEEGSELHCVAAPGLPGFSAHVGTMAVGPKGGSCGTAVYRREPVYVTDILTDPIWDLYRDRLLPYGIRSVWSRPLFTSEGRALGTFIVRQEMHTRRSFSCCTDSLPHLSCFAILFRVLPAITGSSRQTFLALDSPSSLLKPITSTPLIDSR
jgi:formate hydrogenlyase transcriptional activator